MKPVLMIMMVLALTRPAWAEESAAATPQTGSPAIPSVMVAAAATAEVQAWVPVTGTLVARQEVLIFPQVTGFEITEVLVEAGDSVKKGQVLARVSRDTLAAQLAQADAEYQRADAGVRQAQSQIASAAAALTQAQATLNRAEQLRSSGSASQAMLDDAVAADANAQAQASSAADGLGVARAALAQADAARGLAQLNLDRTDIAAPVDGLIIERQAELGAISGAGGDPLFRLVAGGEIELAAEVIETALYPLSVGDPALIDVAGIGRVEGKVRLLPASVDPITRLGKMRIALGRDPKLRTGLFASGAVITAQHDAITVPATAVLTDDEGERVQLVVDGIVHSQKVRAGLLWQSLREIESGIDEGQTVISRSGAFFRDGDRVRPVVADAQADGADEDQARPTDAESAESGAAKP